MSAENRGYVLPFRARAVFGLDDLDLHRILTDLGQQLLDVNRAADLLGDGQRCGGCIGQSRLCMFFLSRVPTTVPWLVHFHLGERALESQVAEFGMKWG